jgi:hypothetical protein
MDPVTAIAQAIKAIADMVTELSRGQPPEVRKQMWEWFMEAVKALRALFKPPVPPSALSRRRQS